MSVSGAGAIGTGAGRGGCRRGRGTGAPQLTHDRRDGALPIVG